MSTSRRRSPPLLCCAHALLAGTVLSLCVTVAATAIAMPPARSLVEDVATVPVRFGAAGLRRDLVVTVVRREGDARAPWLVLLHGRAAEQSERARLGRVDYPANARYLAGLGFAVFIPTRIGYGATGGPDLENTGPCAAKRFEPAISAALDEVRQVAAFARRQRYVDPSSGLLVGESFGGMIAVAAAADPLPGLRGVVNVAGGDGGDSLRHPDAPCGADLLEKWYAGRAPATRIPSLWLYSANDRLWGPVAPRRWWNAFHAAGGRGEFQELPPDKNNGHFIFVRNPPAWHPAFERFAASLGLASPTGD